MKFVKIIIASIFVSVMATGCIVVSKTPTCPHAVHSKWYNDRCINHDCPYYQQNMRQYKNR